MIKAGVVQQLPGLRRRAIIMTVYVECVKPKLRMMTKLFDVKYVWCGFIFSVKNCLIMCMLSC